MSTPAAYDYQAEVAPRVRSSPFLLHQFEKLEADTAASAYFMREQGMPPEQIGATSIELTADKQYDTMGNPVLGEYFPDSRRTAVHLSMIAAIGTDYYGLSDEALDRYVTATASATLAHEPTHAALQKNPAVRAAERRFNRHVQLRTRMVRAGSAAVLAQSVGTLLLDTPSAVPAGLCIVADVLALRYFQRYHRTLPQAVYAHDPEEIVCRAVELSAPHMVTAVLRKTRLRAR